MNLREKCDHAVGTVNFGCEGLSLADKEEALKYPNQFESFDFCPLCGSPLRETALDRVLWRAVNKPNPGGLFPSQSLEHAVEFLKQARTPNESYISIDKIISSYETKLYGRYFQTGTELWEVSIRATEFFSASLSKALTKALLWATTELDKETVESLIKEEKES